MDRSPLRPSMLGITPLLRSFVTAVPSNITCTTVTNANKEKLIIDSEWGYFFGQYLVVASI